MKEKYLPNQKYYVFSTNCYCGVVVDKKTMKRIQKVLYEAESKTKKILHNSNNVKACDWGVVNIMDGEKFKKQKLFEYSSFCCFDNVERRINAFTLANPKYMKDFYEIKSEEELEDLKRCLIKELEEASDDTNRL